MKKVLVLGIAAISLIAFSGFAAGGTLYAWSYTAYNTQGWLDLGHIGGYHIFGKYNYRAYEAYGMDYGWIYLMDINVHSNWHIKCIDGNKPITITHYNCLVKYHAEVVDPAGTNIVSKDICRGHLRLIDPKASDKPYGYYYPPEQAWMWFTGLNWCLTKVTDHRPHIEDATTLISAIFENVDIALIPLIQYAYFEIGTNTIQMDFNWS